MALKSLLHHRLLSLFLFLNIIDASLALVTPKTKPLLLSCKDRVDQYTRHPLDCSRWFYCSNEQPIEMPPCMDGKIFSMTSQSCISRTNANNDCDNVCDFGGELHFLGETFVGSDPCEKCVCQNNNGDVHCNDVCLFKEANCSYKGRTYQVGQYFMYPDGCNTCQCGEFGVVRCTDIKCQTNKVICYYQKTVYVAGEEFLHRDGQHTCTCRLDGVVSCHLSPARQKKERAECLYDEKRYSAGTVFLSEDHCNQCECLDSGHVACTTFNCSFLGHKRQDPIAVTAGANHPAPTTTTRKLNGCYYRNTVYNPGDTFTANDGCNSCSCSLAGQVVCTQKTCLYPRVSHQIQQEICFYAGQQHQFGQSFTSTDGCNSCTCFPDGKVQCTESICPTTHSKISDPMKCIYGEREFNQGESFFALDGCNYCNCSQSGQVQCSSKDCSSTSETTTTTTIFPSTTEKSGSLRRMDFCFHKGKQYKAGETFSTPCDICYCSQDGKVHCIRLICPPDSDEAQHPLHESSRLTTTTMSSSAFGSSISSSSSSSSFSSSPSSSSSSSSFSSPSSSNIPASLRRNNLDLSNLHPAPNHASLSVSDPRRRNLTDAAFSYGPKTSQTLDQSANLETTTALNDPERNTDHPTRQVTVSNSNNTNSLNRTPTPSLETTSRAQLRTTLADNKTLLRNYNLQKATLELFNLFLQNKNQSLTSVESDALRSNTIPNSSIAPDKDETLIRGKAEDLSVASNGISKPKSLTSFKRLLPSTTSDYRSAQITDINGFAEQTQRLETNETLTLFLKSTSRRSKKDSHSKIPLSVATLTTPSYLSKQDGVSISPLISSFPQTPYLNTSFVDKTDGTFLPSTTTNNLDKITSTLKKSSPTFLPITKNREPFLELGTQPVLPFPTARLNQKDIRTTQAPNKPHLSATIKTLPENEPSTLSRYVNAFTLTKISNPEESESLQNTKPVLRFFDRTPPKKLLKPGRSDFTETFLYSAPPTATEDPNPKITPSHDLIRQLPTATEISILDRARNIGIKPPLNMPVSGQPIITSFPPNPLDIFTTVHATTKSSPTAQPTVVHNSNNNNKGHLSSAMTTLGPTKYAPVSSLASTQQSTYPKTNVTKPLPTEKPFQLTPPFILTESISNRSVANWTVQPLEKNSGTTGRTLFSKSDIDLYSNTRNSSVFDNTTRVDTAAPSTTAATTTISADTTITAAGAISTTDTEIVPIANTTNTSANNSVSNTTTSTNTDANATSAAITNNDAAIGTSTTNATTTANANTNYVLLTNSTTGTAGYVTAMTDASATITDASIGISITNGTSTFNSYTPSTSTINDTNTDASTSATTLSADAKSISKSQVSKPYTKTFFEHPVLFPTVVSLRSLIPITPKANSLSTPTTPKANLLLTPTSPKTIPLSTTTTPKANLLLTPTSHKAIPLSTTTTPKTVLLLSPTTPKPISLSTPNLPKPISLLTPVTPKANSLSSVSISRNRKPHVLPFVTPAKTSSLKPVLFITTSKSTPLVSPKSTPVREIEFCNYDGRRHRIWDVFAAKDGCNTCECLYQGIVHCTEMPCRKQGLPPVTTPLVSTTTTFLPFEGTPCIYNGVRYKLWDVFSSSDGCNTCDCFYHGFVHCTDQECREENDKTAMDKYSIRETCVYKKRELRIGQTFLSEDKCTVCNCTLEGQIRCTDIHCPSENIQGIDQKSKLDEQMSARPKFRKGIVTTTPSIYQRLTSTPFVAKKEFCLYNGHSYRSGETFMSDDDCNTCTCRADNSVTCTHLPCTRKNALSDQSTCTYNGHVYQNGQMFSSADGCNTCGCLDAGAILCTSQICGSGKDWFKVVTTTPVKCSYGGQLHQVGDIFNSTDNCNSCKCTQNGQVTCTQKTCRRRPESLQDDLVSDSSVPDMCLFEGRLYERGQVFQAVDACNTCTCTESGRIVCTDKACLRSSNKTKERQGPTGPFSSPTTLKLPTTTNPPRRTVKFCSYDGKIFQVGEVFSAINGCKRCSCTIGGRIECSEKGCPLNIAGQLNTVSDSLPSHLGVPCVYKGQMYKANQVFPSSDECNTCTCSDSGAVHCTENLCQAKAIQTKDRDESAAKIANTTLTSPTASRRGSSSSSSNNSSKDPVLGKCLYNEQIYWPGDRFYSVDGCNMCNCSNDGTVKCDQKSCLPRNGVSKDVAMPLSGKVGMTCLYARQVYLPDQVFPSSDGCNTCVCSDDGRVHCTENPCSESERLKGELLQDGAIENCILGNKLYKTGDTFDSSDGCNVCGCSEDGNIVCTNRTCYPGILQNRDSPEKSKITTPKPLIPRAKKIICQYKGKFHAPGSIFKAADSCNMCGCLQNGIVHCTKNICDSKIEATTIQPKTSTTSKLNLLIKCRYMGKKYDIGQTFEVQNGCNTCACLAEGALRCTKHRCDPPIVFCTHGGKVYFMGQNFANECNTCKCGAHGIIICAEIDCKIENENRCKYNGEEREAGETFRSNDGCHLCTCSAQNRISCRPIPCHLPRSHFDLSRERSEEEYLDD